MGAVNFRTYREATPATATAQAAFTEARERALYLNGHGGYTGTIAEKPGFEMRDGGKLFTKEEAGKFANADEDNNDKWEAAFCIRVTEDGKNVSGWLFYGLAPY